MFSLKFIDKDFYTVKGEKFDAIKAAENFFKPIGKLFKPPETIPEDAVLGERYSSFTNHYVKGQKLGSGAFGEVYIVHKKKAADKRYACKEQAKEKINIQGLEKLVLHESLIMKHLKGHKNVATLEKAFEDQNNVYFIMDLCERGDVLKTITRTLKKKGTYTERDASGLAREMFEAIKFCHDRGVIHRDIKPENFLWTDDGVMKVTDFGLSAFFTKGQKFDNPCGTPPYVAPEVWRGRPYDEKVDVWALGVTLYIMLIGAFPFNGEDVEQLRDNIVLQKIDYDFYPLNFLSNCCREFLSKLLEKNPDKRLTLDEALEHPWLAMEGAAANENLKTRVDINIAQLYEKNDFLVAAMNKLSLALNDSEYREIERRFEMTDLNHDGKLDFEELYKSIPHVAPEHAAKIFDLADEGSKGYISKREFMVVALTIRSRFMENKAIQTFRMLDVDGDGQITKDEMRQVLSYSDLNDEDLERIHAEMDTNHDGQIDFQEFCDYWKANVAGAHQIMPITYAK